jgi:choline dehydrogenase-like flavoprotein
VAGLKLGFDDYTADGGNHVEVKVEVAVIGAGAGGCAVACALAERGIETAVFEEGRHWKSKDFKSSNPWAFKNLYQDRGARVAIGSGWLPVNGGRGVGGSTLINSAISFKTPPSIVEDWRKLGFNPDGDFMDLVDRVWTDIGVMQNPESVQGANNILFKQGTEAMGMEGAYLHRSAPSCTGCGVCQLGCPSGGKNSADRTFLYKALQLGGVTVYADCRAEGVESSGGRITAVTGKLIHPDSQKAVGTFRVVADRFVLSAGPIGSPRFLLKNGLDPNEHVGQHLRLHPAIGVYALFEEEVVHWHGVSQGYYVDRWDEGWLLQTATITPDNQFLGIPLPVGPELNEVMSQMRHLGAAGAIIHDEDSVGSVGRATISFELGDHDRQLLIKGMRETARVWFAAGAHTTISSVVGGGLIRDPGDIDKVISLDTPYNRLLAVASHPMGTNRMGSDPDKAVVDPSGRVGGWDNLFVADASVFPSSLGVNPQVTVMAIGLMVGRGV